MWYEESIAGETDVATLTFSQYLLVSAASLNGSTRKWQCFEVCSPYLPLSLSLCLSLSPVSVCLFVSESRFLWCKIMELPSSELNAE